MQAASSGSTPITLVPGPQVLHEGGDAGGQPAAAHRHEDRLDRPGMLLQDLLADRPLAGDHVRVVEGMQEGQALLGLEGLRLGERLVEGVAVQDDLRAARPAGIDLDGRGGARHHDHRPGAEPGGGQRDALRVVARRGADHAAGDLFGAEARHLVVGAAQFEREDRLQILTLQQHGAAESLRHPRHRIEGALDRHVVDAGGEDLADVVGHLFGTWARGVGTREIAARAARCERRWACDEAGGARHSGRQNEAATRAIGYGRIVS